MFAIKAILESFADAVGRYDPDVHSNCIVYKVRAETPRDVIVAFAAATRSFAAATRSNARTKIMEIHKPIYTPGDTEVSFASTLTLDELRLAWESCEDLHVMVDSVSQIGEF
jgi:hypothetical protein